MYISLTKQKIAVHSIFFDIYQLELFYFTIEVIIMNFFSFIYVIYIWFFVQENKKCCIQSNVCKCNHICMVFNFKMCFELNPLLKSCILQFIK